LNICQSFVAANGNITLISQDNSGVSSARNRGLGVAKGEYVMFVDCDDYMLPQMCEIMANAIQTKDADLVVCGTTETWGGLWAPDRDVDYQTMESFRQDFIEHLNSELLSPPWNKIYRRELIKDVFDTSISFGEDLVFNLNYLKNCQRVSFIKSAPFYHEKANENSLVNRIYPSRLIEIEKVHSTVVGFYESDDPKLHQKYVRDILVYFRAILKSKNCSKRDKCEQLNIWASSCQLNKISFKELQINWKDKLLLTCAKLRLWTLAEVIVKFKSFISR
jgi:glycosyltransferase involved in cell wall biosynthesis